MTAIGPANLIKAQILSNLQSLVSAGDLMSVIEQDLNINILQSNISQYPVAILGTSSLEANWEYQQNNRRTYRYDIMVAQLQDNLRDPGAMEDLRDAIALRFDNNFTLAGMAPLGVNAVFSERMTIGDSAKTLVLFYVTIRATTLVNLVYNP